MSLGFGRTFALLGIGAAILLFIAMITTFDRPPVTTVQLGFRGVAMQAVYNPREVQTYLAANKLPATLPQLPAAGPRASAVYKNVQVLQNLSVGQFTRLMASITTWVAPTQGCAYCHNTANMAEDSVYTKIVARRMIQMVQHINADWKPHVGTTGVTCYTCHRGNPVPNGVWFHPGNQTAFNGMAENNTGKNLAAAQINNSSLPYDPFTPFLENDQDIRVQASQALPGTDNSSIKQAEWTYSLMIHFAQSLGVNCTYCHNTRSLGDWSQSTPMRVTAWHGIRMVRDLNNDYLKSLQGVFPPARLGPTGDVAKLACVTCHQGVFKPLYGASMVSTFPELQGPTTLTSAAGTTRP